MPMEHKQCKPQHNISPQKEMEDDQFDIGDGKSVIIIGKFSV